MTQFLQQNQTMKQTHILTQKNRQALEVLKMDSRELLELISESVQQNPFLDFHPCVQGDDYLLQNAIRQPSLQEDLYMQLHTLRQPYDEALCSYLIESLDEHGFLSGSIRAYCEDLHTDEETLLQQLEILQSLEPCGVAARSIREAMLLQCRRSHNPLGEQILSEYAQELAEGDIALIARGMQISVREVREVIASLRTCNPNPCAEYTKDRVETILPEVEICVQDKQLQIIPMRDGATLVQEQYIQAIEQNEQLKAYFREANLLFETLNRRNATLLLIMNELVTIQKHHMSCSPARCRIWQIEWVCMFQLYPEPYSTNTISFTGNAIRSAACCVQQLHRVTAVMPYNVQSQISCTMRTHHIPSPISSSSSS